MNLQKNNTIGGIIITILIIGAGLVLVSKKDFSLEKLTNEQQAEREPRQARSVGELLSNSPYDEEVTLYGEVRNFGELVCPCFELVSGNGKVTVWFGETFWDDGTAFPPVSSVERIQNGMKIFVVGYLKEETRERGPNNFWAIDIEPDITGFEREGYAQTAVSKKPQGTCNITGCNNEICSDKPIESSCASRPEHACYASATCARQPDGACGWTRTEALQSCIQESA